MIVVMRSGATERHIEVVMARLAEHSLSGHLSQGEERSIIGVVGAAIAPTLREELELLEGVQEVVRITRPYKLAAREFHPQDTIVHVRGIPIGGPGCVVIAGPCAVENERQIVETETARILEKAIGGKNRFGTEEIAEHRRHQNRNRAIETGRENTPAIRRLTLPVECEFACQRAAAIGVECKIDLQFIQRTGTGQSEIDRRSAIDVQQVGDDAVGAGLVEHGDRLLEVGAGRVGQGAGDEVGAAAGVLPDEQADRPLGEFGGGRGIVAVEVAAAGAER